MKHQAEPVHYETSDNIGMFDLRRRHAPESATGSALREHTSPMFPILEGLVAVVLLVQGFAKLFGSSMISPLFDQEGVGLWLRYSLGVMEVTLAILLLNPRPRFLSSFMMRKPDKRSVPPHDSDDARNERATKGDLSHVF